MSLPTSEVRTPERADGWVVVCPDTPLRVTSMMAQDALRLAREMAPKVTGDGARGLRTAAGDGWYGIWTTDDYMLFQNRGTKPRVMRELAGKAQPLDEPVLTPHGWRRMGALSEGDLVIGSDGAPIPVTGIFPQGVLDCYQITFSDGTSVLCSPDHLWTVRRIGSGDGRWETRTTAYLMDRPQVRWALPTLQPVQFDGLSHLPLHPYIVGALIGDGYLGGSSPTLTAKESAVPREVELLLPDGVTIQQAAGSLAWHITAGRRGTRVNPVARALSEIGLWGSTSGTKFIPPTYMAASVADRLSLLQGLMDADGSSSPDGHLRYSTISERLAENVADLVRGLGGVASVSRPGHTWTVALRLPSGMSPYRADQERRLRYEAAPTVRRRMAKSIRSIEPVEPTEMQCISVEATDSLYVTSGYTLTHNTIPMWITDEDGTLTDGVPVKSRGDRTRVTADGRRQVLIFRKAAPIGSTKQVRRRNGSITSVPRAYPGAPRREQGRFAGVYWRHPGLPNRQYVQDALLAAADFYKIEVSDLYPARIGT